LAGQSLTQQKASTRLHLQYMAVCQLPGMRLGRNMPVNLRTRNLVRWVVL